MKALILLTSSGGLMAGIVAGCIGPMAGSDAALLQIPTVALLVLLIVARRREWIELSGFVCGMAFLGLHTLAAYYGYCNVPYDDWLQSAAGFRSADVFDSDRNHFDRLLHACYGLLAFTPVRQFASYWLGVRGAAATWVAVEFILASSLLYEVVEWLIAVGLAPEIAERYNGQQGDLWDAQKDMALAASGAIVAAIVCQLGVVCRSADNGSKSSSSNGSNESPSMR